MYEWFYAFWSCFVMIGATFAYLCVWLSVMIKLQRWTLLITIEYLNETLFHLADNLERGEHL